MVYTELGLSFYRVCYRPNTFFRVDRLAGVPTNASGKKTVQSALVTDLMRWYRKPFVEVMSEWQLGDEEGQALVRGGKEARSHFTESQSHVIDRYNAKECELTGELGSLLEDTLQQLGLPRAYPLTVGGVAGRLAATKHVQNWRSEVPPYVEEAVSGAFHGGRMQVCRFGQFKDVRHYDIRSAYGWAMSELPDMLGHWHPTNFYRKKVNWALYKVRWNFEDSDHPVMPFPHRDEKGYIHYPPKGTGWYWSPIVRAAVELYGWEKIQLLEGWEYEPATEVKPFDYMHELYGLRQALGSDPAASILKLIIVASWGRLCSTGGKRKRGGKDRPRGNESLLDWAGMTTSLIHERLLRAIHATGQERFIACCVDGFFTTGEDYLGTMGGLGDWAIETLDELFLIRPAFYWAKRQWEWECKTSGIPADLGLLDEAMREWDSRRFRGVVAASQRHCRGLLECARQGDFSRLGEFEDVRQVLHLNPGMAKYGHVCPSLTSGNKEWERWLPYWPPMAKADTMSRGFQSRTERRIPEEIAGEAQEETSDC